MSKKSLVLVLSLVLALAVGLGGTLAFFTDRDSETNIFTVGNVDIDLSEDFEQGAELIPGNKIEKVPVITNVGNNEAYVWMTVAIPAGMESEEGASKNLLHWNWLGGTSVGGDNSEAKIQSYIDNGYLSDELTAAEYVERLNNGDIWYVDGVNEVATEVIDGVKYNVYLFKYKTPLAPGETTLPSFHQVYMDTHIDIDPNGDLYWVENGVTTAMNYNINTMGYPKIYVSAYGIQADGFEDVDEALDAYGVQWGESYVEVNTQVAETKEEAQELLDNAAAGTVIMLAPNVDYGTLYLRQNLDNPSISQQVENNWAGGNHTYKRTIDGLTIIGAKGAIVDEIKVEALSYVNGTVDSQGNTLMQSIIDINGLTLENITFSGEKTALSLGSQHGVYDGITMVGCSMDVTGSKVYLFFDDAAGDNSKNLTITDCEVNGAYQVVEIRPTQGVTITNNKFTNTEARVILLSGGDDRYADVKITGNVADGMGERFLRATKVDGIVVTGNTLTNCNGTDADVIKIDNSTEVTVDGNTVPADKTITK